MTGLFVWVAVYGGIGRAGSVVGGVACLGVVVLAAAGAALVADAVAP